MRAFFAALLLAGMMGQPARAQVLEFSALDGWTADRQLGALMAFRQTCDLLEGDDWAPICKVAADIGETDAEARQFFELFFKPVMMGNPPALFTGYYEPELSGSLARTSRFKWPIYARPPELQDGQVWYSRAVIDGGILQGRGLEIAWLDDPVEAYFLHVQGSGRIRLPDGTVIRVGYAGKNGQPYRSAGQEMVRRGLRTLDQVSAQGIKAWVRANPQQGQDLLNHNPSYVFFRRISIDAGAGPIGAMGRSIFPLRSVAIDPVFTPLGAPVWVEKDGRDPIRRLMIAQDTGGVIKGAQRADIFFGTGDAAGDAAGTVKDGGRMIVLLPIDRAFATLPGQ